MTPEDLKGMASPSGELIPKAAFIYSLTNTKLLLYAKPGAQTQVTAPAKRLPVSEPRSQVGN